MSPGGHCPRCDGRPALVSMAWVMGEHGGPAEVYLCGSCGWRFIALSSQGEKGRLSILLSPMMEDVKVLRALYRRGHVWDEQLDKESRRVLRRLEAMGLVRCVTQRDKRSYWRVSGKGLGYLEGSRSDED